MLATIFTSSGQPVLLGGGSSGGATSVSVKEPLSPFIKPLDQADQGNNISSKQVFLAPPPSAMTGRNAMLGQIGRNASADYDGGNSGAAAFDEGNLRRNVLGRSVSEKIGHRSELMSQVQRTAWARHTTK